MKYIKTEGKWVSCNDEDREQFVINSEGWYRLQKHSRQSMRTFVRENKEAIDKLLLAQMNFDPEIQAAERKAGWNSSP